MPSLRQLAAHAPLLVLDAASARIQVGWIDAAGAARWSGSDEEAGIGLFRGIAQVGADPNAAGAFVFCEGPGSILGVRTSAMAIRTWLALRARPVFAYSSLALVAEAMPARDVTVIADARRATWHAFRRGEGLRRIAAADLAGELVMPEHFRHWSPLPANVAGTPYDVAALFARVPDAGLFQPTDSPDAFLHEEPSYVTWKPQIHRGP